MLDKSQREFYSRHGYLLIERAVDPELLSGLRQVTDEFVEASRAIMESNEVFDLDAGHTREMPRLTRIKLPHVQHPVYRELVFGTAMVELLTDLLGPDVRLHTTKLNIKAPGGGAAVEWHQDWAFYPHTNDDLLAVGVLLDEVDEQNGPLMVIPGTHEGAILDHCRNGVFCGAVDPDDALFEPTRAIALTGPAGSLSVHHVRLLHGSSPNRSSRSRRMLFIECGAADAWPINGAASSYTGLSQQNFWQDMQARMIVGRQTLQPRLETVPVRMPLPPPEDASSIFKVQASGGAVSAFNR